MNQVPPHLCYIIAMLCNCVVKKEVIFSKIINLQEIVISLIYYFVRIPVLDFFCMCT